MTDFKDVLIIGGLGFIGSAIAKRFLAVVSDVFRPISDWLTLY
jgi:nucleoside-diphosphate-sugar epimerase